MGLVSPRHNGQTHNPAMRQAQGGKGLAVAGVRAQTDAETGGAMLRRALIWLTLPLLLCFAAAGEAVPPEPGVIRVTSPLPRTLPLHVRSPHGLDVLVRLHDPATGTEVLAAYGRGGSLFRVLVPPGQFLVTVAVGKGWIDDRQLFGPETRLTSFGPLDFGISGRGRRNGQIITILPDGKALMAGVAPLVWCQGRHVDWGPTELIGPEIDGLPDPPPKRRLRNFACG